MNHLGALSWKTVLQPNYIDKHMHSWIFHKPEAVSISDGLAESTSLVQRSNGDKIMCVSIAVQDGLQAQTQWGYIQQ